MTANPANPENAVATPAAAAPIPAAQRTRWAWRLATGFGLGYLRPPGTWASAATVLAWWFMARALPPALVLPVAVVAAAGIALLGMAAATIVAGESGREDPQVIVVDEIAGQLTALIAVGLTWQLFLAGFILFRFFDILKPPPVRHLERVAGGAGIVLDDLMAGLYARLALAALSYFGVLT